uniref:C-type lectin domain-containing protein n=1 Tax=Pelusios castaneus TaxID=367368 RepID=A0A8C8SLS3_9SAUR
TLFSATASPHSVLSRHVRSGIQATFCHTDWLHYKGHCYGFFLEKMTWSEAEVECQHNRLGAHLASILTKEEGDVVAKYISMTGYKGHVWIGLHDARQDRRWKWTDGSLHRYSAWEPKQPDNWGNTEHCAQLTAKYSKHTHASTKKPRQDPGHILQLSVQGWPPVRSACLLPSEKRGTKLLKG